MSGVIPGGSNPVPDGASTASGMAELQKLTTEVAVKDQLKMKALTPLGFFRTSWINDILGGIGQALHDGIRGVANSLGNWFGSIFTAGEVVKDVKDGQEALAGRQDLLDDLLNMGRSYCSRAEVYPANTWNRVNFDRDFGISRGCEIYAGGIQLLRRGQWDIWAQVYTTNVIVPIGGPRVVEWQVRVYVPTGSGEGSWELYSTTNGRLNGNSPSHDTIITSVVVDVDQAHVEVWMKTNISGISTKTFGYGPSYNQLTVKQVTSERVGGTGAEESGLENQ